MIAVVVVNPAADHHKQCRPLWELGNKCAAQLLLTDHTSGILVPTKEEWYGLMLLERDDGLTRPPKKDSVGV